MVFRLLPLAFAALVLLPTAARAAETSAVVLEADLETLFTPEPALQSSCRACEGNHTTSPGGGAASHWGFGSTCTNALNDLANQTRIAATNLCINEGYLEVYGVCSFFVIQTAPCWWSSSYNSYVVDGYANFSCKVWAEGPGCLIP